jgi:hypothetical protein
MHGDGDKDSEPNSCATCTVLCIWGRLPSRLIVPQSAVQFRAQDGQPFLASFGWLAASKVAFFLQPANLALPCLVMLLLHARRASHCGIQMSSGAPKLFPVYFRRPWGTRRPLSWGRRTQWRMHYSSTVGQVVSDKHHLNCAVHYHACLP